MASNDSQDLHKSVICLFDVDGTVTDPRQVILDNFVYEKFYKL